MWFISMPAIAMNSEMHRWLVEPTPEVAKSILPGLALALAISSSMVFTPSEGCTTSTFGKRATMVIGANDFSMSNGRLL